MTSPIALNNVSFSLPGLSMNVPYLGNVTVNKVTVNSGTFDPSSGILRINTGSISLTAYGFLTGGTYTATVSSFSLVPNAAGTGLQASGSGCVGGSCLDINSNIPFTNNFNYQTYLATLNKYRVGRRLGGFPNSTLNLNTFLYYLHQFRG